MAIIGLMGINFGNMNFYAGMFLCVLGIIMMKFGTYVLEELAKEQE